MPANLTQQLIEGHLVEGRARAGEEIGLKIDQTLTQDATGTLVMLELEAMGLDRVQTEVSAQYVDHNLIQEDYRNPDDHRFLRSACKRFGVYFSPPGNGVSHPLHQDSWGEPGKTLLGSDSHTCAAGALGMLAIGAGGIDVAQAMAGRPYYLPMPKVWGVHLEGRLPEWVSAKDIILELLRRHSVKAGLGYVLEYYGPGVETLNAMDRHVIANMGTELGATSTVFASDEQTERFLQSRNREDAWRPLSAESGAEYDRNETIDLTQLEPLIAMPSSPDNVRPVTEVAGEPVYQCYVGSSANPGFGDYAVVARTVRAGGVADGVSLDINPSTRLVLQDLIHSGDLGSLVAAGARLHQAGCNGCIGMGQAPATDAISLRTVPRNFPGRSGTREDQVCLVSPETAAASANTGVITDPREMQCTYARPDIADRDLDSRTLYSAPPAPSAGKREPLAMGPNIKPYPDLGPLPDRLRLKTELILGDHISTDEILPAGTRVLPYRSNLPKISEFAFADIDEEYEWRTQHTHDDGHLIVAGENYGQGSSREHAALAPRYRGLRIVLAVSFARIHELNLINAGVLPLRIDPADRDSFSKIGELWDIAEIHQHLEEGTPLELRRVDDGEAVSARHALSERQKRILLAGGLINLLKEEGDTAT